MLTGMASAAVQAAHSGPPGFLDPNAFADQVAERVLARQALANAPDTRTVNEALDLVMAHPRNLKPRSLRQYHQGLAHVRRAIGNVRVCDLSHEHVKALWAALPPKSIASYGGGIKASLSLAEKLGVRGMAAFVEKLPDHGQTARRNVLVTAEQHREAIAAIQWARVHTMTTRSMLWLLDIQVRCPFRQSELASLEIDACQLDDGFVELVDSKDGAGEVPLTDVSITILRRQIGMVRGADPHARYVWPGRSGGHVHPAAVGQAWTRNRDVYADNHPTNLVAQQLRKLREHDFRHYLTTLALRFGAAPESVRKALRHSEQTMLRRYSHLVTKDARNAMQLVEDVSLEQKHSRRHKWS